MIFLILHMKCIDKQKLSLRALFVRIHDVIEKSNTGNTGKAFLFVVAFYTRCQGSPYYVNIICIGYNLFSLLKIHHFGLS